MNPISAILNRATEKTERLKIVTWMTHERYQPLFCKINADFYSLPGPNVRPSWNTNCSPIPENYHFVNDLKHIIPDVFLSQNPLVHIPLGAQLSKAYHVPLISLFHTDSIWPTPDGLNQNKAFFEQAHHNVFISDYSKITWGFKDWPNGSVITHAIDSDLFCPLDIPREDVILSVVNDWANRDRECGFNLWRSMVQGLPVKVVGNTAGLSEPSKSLDDMIKTYQSCRIFLNTSLRSPLPMSLVEAMSCGLGIVTTNTNAIPDVCEHGYNALIYSPNEPEQGRAYLEKLLKDKELCKRLGKNARNTILEKFKIQDFVDKWEILLRMVCGKVYK